MNAIALAQQNRQRVIDKVTTTLCTGNNTGCAGIGKEFTCSDMMALCADTCIAVCHGCEMKAMARQEPETFIGFD